ncbi:MAG: hypothetical protein A3K19_09695 [Lentisphaerae bacterium RIFOXYB12_FULL_65_16]|nr:MAG: hypothetical protein A3K18_17215 [Lentisphaerae bacterium RIFOXYA12_64_32]OGV84068.1 MAG: hypothetical protein A3K19_09695 [Lentisphaerae bacterium RIFOXYB12_FULL_65_16]
MTWPETTRWIRNRYVVAVAIIAAATALRAWPLHALGTRMAWLTFYPAVMAALPSAFRTELADALVSLDAARIAGSIRRVAESNPVLSNILEHHAGQLQYTVILQALRAGGEGQGAGNQ